MEIAMITPRRYIVVQILRSVSFVLNMESFGQLRTII